MYGKTIGNGYALTSVVGRKAVMEAVQNTFVSSTFWTERIGPTAALATLKVMKEAFDGKNAKPNALHSVVQVRPQVKWPTIDDKDSGEAIEDALELFEDNTALCNDGQGMRPSERLTTLKQILKPGAAKEQI